MSMPSTSVPEIVRAPSTIAIDTTFILCANSALFPTAKLQLQDKDADDALMSLLVYLCNGRNIAYVRPGPTRPTAKVPLLEVVTEFAQPPEFLPLNPAYDVERVRDAANDFVEYLTKAKGADLLSWVKFQFDDDTLVQIFFDGGENEQVTRLELAHRVLQEQDDYVTALDIWETSGAAQLLLPERHARAARQLGISHHDYSFAYALFGFAKGQTYGLQLPDRVRSCEHWLRTIAGDMLRRRQNGNEGETYADTQPFCFNWGRYLPGVFCYNSEFRTTAGIASIINLAREKTTPGALADIVSAGKGGSSPNAARAITKASDEFAGRILANAGCKLPLQDAAKYWARQKRVASMLPTLLGSLLLNAAGLGPWAQVATLAAFLLSNLATYKFEVKPTWYQKFDQRTRRWIKAKLSPDFDMDQLKRWAEDSARTP